MNKVTWAFCAVESSGPIFQENNSIMYYCNLTSVLTNFLGATQFGMIISYPQKSLENKPLSLFFK